MTADQPHDGDPPIPEGTVLPPPVAVGATEQVPEGQDTREGLYGPEKRIPLAVHAVVDNRRRLWVRANLVDGDPGRIRWWNLIESLPEHLLLARCGPVRAWGRVPGEPPRDRLAEITAVLDGGECVDRGRVEWLIGEVQRLRDRAAHLEYQARKLNDQSE